MENAQGLKPSTKPAKRTTGSEMSRDAGAGGAAAGSSPSGARTTRLPSTRGTKPFTAPVSGRMRTGHFGSSE